MPCLSCGCYPNISLCTLPRQCDKKPAPRVTPDTSSRPPSVCTPMATEGPTYVAVLASAGVKGQAHDLSLLLLAGPSATGLSTATGRGCNPQERLGIKNVAALGYSAGPRPPGWGPRPQKPTRLVLGQHDFWGTFPPEPLLLAGLNSLTGLSVHRDARGSQKIKETSSCWVCVKARPSPQYRGGFTCTGSGRDPGSKGRTQLNRCIILT